MYDFLTGIVGMEPMAFMSYLEMKDSIAKMPVPTPPTVKMEAISNVLTTRELGWYGIDTANVNGRLVAIIPMEGVSSKKWGWGGFSTVWAKTQLQLAAGNEQVVAVVLSINSPGGAVNGIFDLSAEIATTQKPVLAHVDYMGASCQALTAMQACEVFLNDEITGMGSLGVMTTIMNYAGQLDKEGVVAKVMRSKGAIDKNVPHPYETLDEGDPKIKAALEQQQNHLDMVEDMLWKEVLAKRPQIDREAVGAKMFFGKEAVKNGFADGIGNLAAVLKRAAYLGSKL